MKSAATDHEMSAPLPTEFSELLSHLIITGGWTYKRLADALAEATEEAEPISLDNKTYKAWKAGTRIPYEAHKSALAKVLFPGKHPASLTARAAFEAAWEAAMQARAANRKGRKSALERDPRSEWKILKSPKPPLEEMLTLLAHIPQGRNEQGTWGLTLTLRAGRHEADDGDAPVNLALSRLSVRLASQDFQPTHGSVLATRAPRKGLTAAGTGMDIEAHAPNNHLSGDLLGDEPLCIIEETEPDETQAEKSQRLQILALARARDILVWDANNPPPAGHNTDPDEFYPRRKAVLDMVLEDGFPRDPASKRLILGHATLRRQKP